MLLDYIIDRVYCAYVTRFEERVHFTWKALLHDIPTVKCQHEVTEQLLRAQKMLNCTPLGEKK